MMPERYSAERLERLMQMFSRRTGAAPHQRESEVEHRANAA